MDIRVLDHNTHKSWRALYESRHIAYNRTNGGFTYSEDIVNHHIPVIKAILAEQSAYKNIIISSVARPDADMVEKDTDLVICYLHENAARELIRIRSFLSWYKGDIIFITSRADVYTSLQSKNMKIIWIPMSIDISAIAKYAKNEKYADKRVLYFGNTYLGKGGGLSQAKQAFIDMGWKFDQISFNMLNGSQTLTRDQIFETISKYKYGIGEGRCVLEMNALGVKTIICASKNQGIFTKDSEFAIQRAHNFADGKIWTFSPDIKFCIENFDKAIIRTIDVYEALGYLRRFLMETLI